MIFESEQRRFESEKERNLYFKFFAGFYFNEFVRWHPQNLDGYSERLMDFYRLLDHAPFRVGEDHMAGIRPSIGRTYVSFDNQIDRYDETYRGEFADILIQDEPNRLLIGIEAKFQDDWDYQKDIVENTTKLGVMAGKLGAENVLLCLLVTKDKWANVVSMQVKKNSNFDRLQNHPSPVVVLHWEMFGELESVHPRVRKYLAKQLALNPE